MSHKDTKMSKKYIVGYLTQSCICVRLMISIVYSNSLYLLWGHLFLKLQQILRTVQLLNICNCTHEVIVAIVRLEAVIYK